MDQFPVSRLERNDHPLGIPLQADATNGVAGWDTRGSDYIDVSGSFSNNWTTVNTAIATVRTGGIHTGVSSGSTNSNTWGNMAKDSGRSLCPISRFSPTGGDNVGPYRVEPIATASQYPPSFCSQGQSGWQRNVTNQLQHSNGSPYAHAGITTADNFSIGSRNDLRVTSIQSGNDVTTGDGSWSDYYYVCSPACPASTGETDALQNWAANGVSLPHVNLVIYKCSSISVDGY